MCILKYFIRFLLSSWIEACYAHNGVHQRHCAPWSSHNDIGASCPWDHETPAHIALVGPKSLIWAIDQYLWYYGGWAALNGEWQIQCYYPGSGVLLTGLVVTLDIWKQRTKKCSLKTAYVRFSGRRLACPPIKLRNGCPTQKWKCQWTRVGSDAERTILSLRGKWTNHKTFTPIDVLQWNWETMC